MVRLFNPSPGDTFIIDRKIAKEIDKYPMFQIIEKVPQKRTLNPRTWFTKHFIVLYKGE